MRGPWTPIRVALTRSSKMRVMAGVLGCDRDAALGAAVRWLAYVTEQFSSFKTNLTEQQLDDELCRPGLTRALLAVGWVALDKNGTVLVSEFGKHSNEKALHADRQAAYRDRMAKSDGASVTKVTEQASPEKNRVEENRLNPVENSTPIPKAYDDVRAALRASNVSFPSEELLEKCSQDFFDSMTACGWRDSQNRILRNWKPYLAKYARSYVEIQNNRTRHGQRVNTRNAGTMNEGRESDYKLH